MGYVYRAGGDAPPWRHGMLISQEEVVIHPDAPVNWHELASCGGFRQGKVCRINLQGQEAPKLWDDLEIEETLDSTGSTPASVVFQSSQQVAVKVLIRGVD